MTPVEKSMLLFILGCIPVRLALVWLAKYKHELLPVMAVLATLVSVGFALIYVFKLRKTGGEVFGEKIWWNDLRPVHSILYLLFAYLAIYDKDNAWKALVIDVSIGIVAFLFKRILM